MGLVTSQPAAGEARNPLFPVRERETQRHRIEILDNPIAAEQPALARSLEAELRRLLKDADVGTVEVRFRVCRDGTAGEAVRFICKASLRRRGRPRPVALVVPDDGDRPGLPHGPRGRPASAP